MFLIFLLMKIMPKMAAESLLHTTGAKCLHPIL